MSAQGLPRRVARSFHGLHKAVTQNPNKCTHYLRSISTKIEIISITIGVLLENSSDLSSGRRPVSKSNEFSKSTPIVIEI